MTWQEELRKLDDDFASGKLSADDYKVRREQVLSSAVAPGTGNKQADHTAHSVAQQQGDLQQGQTQKGKAQQGQQGQAESNGADNDDNQASSDATQVFSPTSPPQGNPQQRQQGAPPEGSAERTQVVSSWQLQQPPPASPSDGSAQTPGRHHPQPPSQQPTQQYAHPHQPWNAPDDDSSPPWGGSEFPPVAPSSDSDWVKQGPEVFQSNSTRTSRRRMGKILAGAVAVLVLVGIALGAYLLWGTGGGEEDPGGGPVADPSPDNAPTATEEPEKLALPELPGTAENHPGIESVDDLPGLNYLTPEELEVYEDTSAGEVNFLVQHLPSDSRAIVLMVEASSADDAQTGADELRDIQLSNDAEELDDPPDDVHVTEYSDSDRDQIRAHYVSDDVLLRIEVVTSEGLSTARSDFDETLTAQLDAMPADG